MNRATTGGSALDARRSGGRPESAHEDPLDGEEEDEGRQGDEQGAGQGHRRSGLGELALQRGQGRHDRADRLVARERQPEEEVIPDPGELQDEDRREGVEREWHEDVAEDRQGRSPVEAGRLPQVGRDRDEVVADDEGGEGDGDRGVEKQQPEVRVVEVPTHVHRVERREVHLEGEDRSQVDGHEPEEPVADPERNDGVGGQGRQQNRQQRPDDRVERGAADGVP